MLIGPTPFIKSVQATVFAPSSCGALSSTNLADEMANEIDSRISGLTTPTNNINLYTTRATSTGTWAKNSSVWTTRGSSVFDLSGQSPWNSTGGYTRAGTLISPRHIVFANHYPIANGATVVFIDADNNIVSRILSSQTNVTGTDIIVGLLNEDVPASIAYYPILSIDQINQYLSLQSQTPMILLDQEDHAIIHDFFSLIWANTTISHTQPLDATRSLFYETIIDGDSGNPGFFAINGQLILALTHYYANSGPFYGDYITQINTAMTSLGGGYQVSTYDLSCFNEHSGPTLAAKTFSINEHLANNTLVGTITATGNPSNMVYTYSILSGNTNSAFAINSSTGNLTVADYTALDYGTTPIFTLVIQATDNWSTPTSSTASVTINLNAVAPGAYLPYAVLKSMGAADFGAVPTYGTPILSLDGTTLYGTTIFGGSVYKGVIYSVGVDGSNFTVLHNFTGGTTDGANPYGSLTLSADGNTLYGMTYAGSSDGSSSNKGVVFSIATTGGVMTYLHSFTGGTTDGANPYGSITLSGTTLYGMTYAGSSGGSASNVGVVFSIPTTGGTMTYLHSFTGGVTDGSRPYGSLTLSETTLYGMTSVGSSDGSASNMGVIFSIPKAGGDMTYLHSFTGGTTDGATPRGALTLSADGTTLYGMTTIGSSGGSSSNLGTIFSIPTLGGDMTYLHSFTGGTTDGSAPRGALTLSVDGNTLYGMTSTGSSGGSSSNKGVIFSIPKAGGDMTYLHSFTGGTTDGATPYGSLTLSGTTLYGMTSAGSSGGSSSNIGVIFSISTAGGTMTYLYSFTGGTGGIGKYSYGSLTLSANGNTLYGMTSQGGSTNVGTIYSVGTDGSNFTLLHSFTGSVTDGASPTQNSLTLSVDGNTLYGMTPGGGTNNKGTIFSIDTDGSDFTLLHSFTGGTTDGATPRGALTLSADGTTLYGMTTIGSSGGSSSNLGTIFSIPTLGGDMTYLHSFTGGTTDGSAPRGALTLSVDGNTLYGMTSTGSSGGSSSNKGVIFSIPKAGGDMTYLHSFTGGTTDGATPYGSLTLSGTTLYGMTYAGSSDGSASNIGIIFSISTAGGAMTYLHSFIGGTTDGSRPYGYLILSGNTLYGTTDVGSSDGSSSNVGVIFSIPTLGGDMTYLHSFIGGTTDGSRPQSSLTLSSNGSTLYGTTYQGGNQNFGTIFSSELDITAPIISNFSPDIAATIVTATPTVTFSLNENGDCKYSLTDQAYDSMIADCTGDGGQSISCPIADLGVDGLKTIYFACEDTLGNKHTADNNYSVNYILDTTAPLGLGETSPFSGSTISDATPAITFSTNENATCRASLSNGSYDSMSNDVDCTGDGSQSITCQMGDLGVDGDKTIYFACVDSFGNKNTINNSHSVNYTLDTTAPTTVADAGTFTFSGWTNDNVTITLSCADGSGSGCAATLYCTDSTNTCTPNTPYIGSFEVVASGGPRGIYVRYLSTDLTSNAETTSYKVINIIGPAGGGAVGGTYPPPETPVIPETPIIIPIVPPVVEPPITKIPDNTLTAQQQKEQLIVQIKEQLISLINQVIQLLLAQVAQMGR